MTKPTIVIVYYADIPEPGKSGRKYYESYKLAHTRPIDKSATYARSSIGVQLCSDNFSYKTLLRFS